MNDGSLDDLSRDPGPDPVGTRTGDGDVEPVASGAVTTVLESLQGLDDRPVVEHAEVFERAHDDLRRLLAGQPALPGVGAVGS